MADEEQLLIGMQKKLQETKDTRKPHHLKYSCEEIYERMDNGLCIFCDELDTPGHHNLKHKGVRIFMVESDAEEEAHQVHETLKTPAPIEENVNTDQLCDEKELRSIDLEQVEGRAKTVAKEKLNLPLGQNIEQLVSKHYETVSNESSPDEYQKDSTLIESSNKDDLWFSQKEDRVWEPGGSNMQVLNCDAEEFKTFDRKMSNETLGLEDEQDDGHELKQVLFSSLEPGHRYHKESLIVVDGIASDLGCVIGKTNECMNDPALVQDDSLVGKGFKELKLGKLSMNKAQYSPDEKTFYVLTSGVCQLKREHKVIRVLEKVKQSKFSLDLLNYNSLTGLFWESKLEVGVKVLLEENKVFRRTIIFGRDVIKWKYWSLFSQMLQAITNCTNTEYMAENIALLEDDKGSDTHGELKLKIYPLMEKHHSLAGQLYNLQSERKRAAPADSLVKEFRQPLSYQKDLRKLLGWSERQKAYDQTWKFKYILKALLKVLLQNEQHKLLQGRNIKCKMRKIIIFNSGCHYSTNNKCVSYHCPEMVFSWLKKIYEMGVLVSLKKIAGMTILWDKETRYWIVNAWLEVQVCSGFSLGAWIELKIDHWEYRQQLKSEKSPFPRTYAAQIKRCGETSWQICFSKAGEFFSSVHGCATAPQREIKSQKAELCSVKFKRENGNINKSFEGLSKVENDHKIEETALMFWGYMFGIEKIAGGLICGVVKFHLKHKWRSRLSQILLELEFCVDNDVLITSSVKLLFTKNYKLLHYEAGLCTHNDLQQLSSKLPNFRGHYFTFLIFIENQALNCGCEAGHISSGISFVGGAHEYFTCSELKIGVEMQGKRLLVLNEIPLLDSDNVDLTITEFYNTPMIRRVFHFQRPPEIINLHRVLDFIAKVLVQWKEHPPDLLRLLLASAYAFILEDKDVLDAGVL